MNRTIYILSLLLLTNFSLFAKKGINQIDRTGNRIGFWILDEANNPVSAKSKNKAKEGYYVNGRKEGVWVLFHKNTSTPRIIGEFSDNRPKGVFFRFDLKGEMVQAGTTRKDLLLQPMVVATTAAFDCKINFKNSELVAGQVFFHKNNFTNKQNSFQFWVEKAFNSNKSNQQNVDYSWLNSNYKNIEKAFDEARIPNAQKSTVEATKVVGNGPVVKSPRMLNGAVFHPNGWNKVYNDQDEIWIDGKFKNAQLWDGKEFIYDTDGVLMKVKVFKNGEFFSNGML